MEIAEQYEHEGVAVKIVYDDDPISPREDCTRGTTIAAWHRRYDIGDEGFNYRNLPQLDSPDELERWLCEECGAIVVKPLYLFEHSCERLSLAPFDDTWDSGQVGFIFVTQQHLDDTGGQAEPMMAADVDEYNSFLSGEAYGYVVDEDGPNEDSCWGFIGDISYVKQEADAVAGGVAAQRVREGAEQMYWAARDVVTI